MTITAYIDLFGAFLVVRGDEDAVEIAAAHAPSWCGATGREWHTDGSLWLPLAVRDVPRGDYG